MMILNILLVISALIAMGLFIWTAWGGPYGRWVAAFLLVCVSGGAMRTFIGTPLYYGYDSDNEKAYMAQLKQAIEQGYSQLRLEQMMPFKWQSMCVVDAPYNEVPKDQQEAIARATKVNVSGWRTEEGQPLMIFGTANGPVLIRDDSEYFVEYVIGLTSSASIRGQVCYHVRDGLEVWIKLIQETKD